FTIKHREINTYDGEWFVNDDVAFLKGAGVNINCIMCLRALNGFTDRRDHTIAIYYNGSGNRKVSHQYQHNSTSVCDQVLHVFMLAKLMELTTGMHDEYQSHRLIMSS